MKSKEKLRSIPYEDLAKEGYGKLQNQIWPGKEKREDGKSIIYLAGGCFWGVQKFLDQFSGIWETQVGYANGEVLSPSYEEVCTQNTGHAEAVKVVYDKEKISLTEILEFYFKVIDPLAKDHQGGDFGHQYRTGIYYVEEEQLKEILPVYESIEDKLKRPLAVEVLPIDNFSTAEEYHQKYLDKNPTGYCHIPKEMMHLKKE
ncbi:MAG TPA: peptide-methionine (S)-S-oxide reductase MsrA [Lachnospiraceae bacterium]